MYDFSGLIFRIWGCYGFMILLGAICFPWKIFKGKKLEKRNKQGLLAAALNWGLGLVFIAITIISMAHPNVASYTGVYLSSRDDSRSAPPLPVTMIYVFRDDFGNRKGFDLDDFSKRKIYPAKFERGKRYTIYYDKFSEVIVRVEEVEEAVAEEDIP